MIISPTKRRKKYGCLAYSRGSVLCTRCMCGLVCSPVLCTRTRYVTLATAHLPFGSCFGFFSINEYFPNGHARPAPRDRNISRRAACNFPKTVCDDLAVRKKGGFTRARIGRVVVLHKQASKVSHRQAIVCGAFFTSCRRSSGDPGDSFIHKSCIWYTARPYRRFRCVFGNTFH